MNEIRWTRPPLNTAGDRLERLKPEIKQIISRRFEQLKAALGKTEQDGPGPYRHLHSEPYTPSQVAEHNDPHESPPDAYDQVELLLAMDRSLTFAPTVTESLDILTGLWASDTMANGQYCLLDFTFTPSALPGMIRHRSAAIATETLDRCVGRRVGMSDVMAIRTTADLFRRLDQKFGGGHARMTAVGYLHRSITPLLTGTYSSKVGRQLFSAIADLTQLVGWMAYDIGQHGLAQRYFSQALRLTRAADDHALGSYILSRMSRQATYLQRPHMAVDLAVASRENAAGHTTPGAMALFYSVEARGHALLGDGQACTAALDRAEQHLNTAKPDDEAAWSRFFDEAQLADEFAHCFRDLSKPSKALHFAIRSLRLRSDSYARSKAFCHTVLATAYLQQGELEQACRTGVELIHEMIPLRSFRGKEYIRDFRRRLSRYHGERATIEFNALVNAPINHHTSSIR